MARFDRAIQTALRLIAKNGEKVKWRVIDDAAAPDPSQPWNPGPATPEDKDVTICFLPVDRQTMETFTFIKGTEVPKGSVMGLMGNVPFNPNLKDVVIRDGVELRIANIDVLSPNGQKVLYTVVFQA
ncbi:head closure Hc1 [Xanthomonas phage vB_Xar_IVIA-DoCa1]|uniref:Virion structural protein n=4 Tax=Septimatrevirus TaxID=1921544 RepID=A0A976SGP9_9CAUD|nr:head closure Hc1 [Pseudomonas phage PaMx42]YP_010597397.1 head closure Hc1 [Pseudomonas phage vB_PaeS-Yazdi-M]YP_010597462.1 head closure Hc1 [Pseudomonas phage Guyu]YP_010597516.1 head closure Hc1 [Xanthomonas phage Samson]YP_010597567.1 head closure Hc1 [Xanthomonas phage vB_Xar_IVIA-DoCa1]UKH49214.1 virion structural protein [Pseudomonas phage vB_Pae_TR]UYA98890.1 virion structural protein [Xanthomonas phage vB_Xar_IVIA-DoCa8]ALH23586.1 virion structural protein [Pseudomonas phage PaMx